MNFENTISVIKLKLLSITGTELLKFTKLKKPDPEDHRLCYFIYIKLQKKKTLKYKVQISGYLGLGVWIGINWREAGGILLGLQEYSKTGLW